MKRFVDLCRDL